jgi:acyl carrier protein
MRARDREILDGIRELAAERLGFEGELRPDMRLAEDLELDSLKVLTLAVEVENRFRICLDPSSEAQIETVSDLVAEVGRQLDRRSHDTA